MGNLIATATQMIFFVAGCSLTNHLLAEGFRHSPQKERAMAKNKTQ
jgi:hypothetical protein